MVVSAGQGFPLRHVQVGDAARGRVGGAMESLRFVCRGDAEVKGRVAIDDESAYMQSAIPLRRCLPLANIACVYVSANTACRSVVCMRFVSIYIAGVSVACSLSSACLSSARLFSVVCLPCVSVRLSCARRVCGACHVYVVCMSRMHRVSVGRTLCVPVCRVSRLSCARASCDCHAPDAFRSFVWRASAICLACVNRLIYAHVRCAPL